MKKPIVAFAYLVAAAIALATATRLPALAQDAMPPASPPIEVKPPTLTYVLTDDEAAQIAEATGQKAEDWLALQVAALVQQCKDVCAQRKLAKYGITAAGLTADEIATILAARQAKADAAAAAIAAPTTTTTTASPAPASGTATPSPGQ